VEGVNEIMTTDHWKRRADEWKEEHRYPYEWVQGQRLPLEWNPDIGMAGGGGFPALDPGQYNQSGVATEANNTTGVRGQEVDVKPPRVSYNPPASTARQHNWLTGGGGRPGFQNMTVTDDFGSYEPPKKKPTEVEWWWEMHPDDWPPPGPPGSNWPGYPPPWSEQPPDWNPPPTWAEENAEPQPSPIQIGPPERTFPPQTPGGPFMPPPFWLLQDPDATGDDVAKAREGKEPWFGVLVHDGQKTMPFEEFAEMTGLPPDQAWEQWHQFFSNTRPEINREGTDYWSTGMPFTSTMGTDQMIDAIQPSQMVTSEGRDILDTYGMVQNNPNVISYPYREEDPDGEWQPGFGQPVNPTMAKRPVPREVPYYDQRGLLEAQILDEMAMRGIPPTGGLDAPGYNPRNQHLYNDTPIGRVDPRAVLGGILKRLRG